MKNKIVQRIFFLSFVMVLVMIGAGSAFAEHDAIVTIDPNKANCDELGNTFTVNVENDASSTDDILQVEIYKALAGISDFICGPAPTGWTLFSYEDRCIYVTGLNSAYKIEPGENLDFTFDATMSSDACESSFIIATTDDAIPGVRNTNPVDVNIDCTNPFIQKTIDEPKVPGTGFDWWVTQSTNIHLSASDNTHDCDLGLDYCRWRVTIDGAQGEWNNVEDGSTLDWDLTFNEDSSHYLEVECYDIAGNKAILTELDKVDSTPPETTKTYGTPYHKSGSVEWINSSTPITLNAVDEKVGVDKTLYLNLLAEDYQLGEDPCWKPEQYCKPMFLSPPPECVIEAEEVCEYDPQDPRSLVECVENYIAEVCFGGRANFKWQVYTGPFNKEEESCHILEYYSIDNLGNMEDVKWQCVFVDNTPPAGTKEVGTPSIPIDEEFQSIGDGTAGWTELESYFGDYSARLYVLDGSKDIAAIEFDVDVAVEDITELSFWQKISNTYGVNVILGVDSDSDGVYEANDKPWHFSHDPNDLGDDSFIEMDGLYQSSGSWEEVDTLSISQWWTPDNAGNDFCPEFGWNPLSDVQSGSKCRIDPTDHVKVIRLLIGGSGSWMNKIAYVDDITLNGETIKLEPRNWWVADGVTPITLTCVDQEPHPVDEEEVCYKVSFDYPEWGYITKDYCPVPLDKDGWCCVDDQAQIIFKEESSHDLEYFCRDVLGNENDIDTEYFKVDSSPPIITKSMIGNSHLGYRDDILNEDACPPKQDGDKCYVKDDGENGVRIDVKDDDTIPEHAVNDVTCTYELWWYQPDKWRLVDGGEFGEEGKDIIFTLDSEHKLIVNCEDGLENKMDEDVETFLVDSTPPTTTKTYGTPYYKAGSVKWINSSTPITLNAVDEKVGVDKIYWRNTLKRSDNPCWNWESCQNAEGSGNFIEYTAPFQKPKESCHLIEYYSVDLLGNTEPVKKQCVFVDNTPPNVSKSVGGPKVPCNLSEGCAYYITSNTPISLYCLDQGPHPVNDVNIWYRYRVDDGQWTAWEDCMNCMKTIKFPTDSKHELEYYCEDALLNKGPTKTEIDIVDNKPPVITKTIVGPIFGDYIDGITEIHVDAIDPQPHPVNNVRCNWDYKVVDGAKTGTGQKNITPPFVITFPEESTHVLNITCWDALGNKAVDLQSFIVDKTPPIITKTYGTPYYTNGSAEWISSNTVIEMEASDPKPHPSGLKELSYRITLLDNEDACWDTEICEEETGSGDWTEYESPIHINEESCHLIEIKAVDNVDKEASNKQCILVDNSPPVPQKLVGEPKARWDGSGSYFYEEETEDCWDGTGEKADKIDCWKVTLLTPISLKCEDKGQHPVNNEYVCFSVEVDGINDTTRYCNYYNGNMNDDGFCCMKSEVDDLYFLEMTEHNLDYYCVDALNNTGPVDDEKFKVEETAFEIQLNRKWNLISVPVKLLDDSIGEVFADIANNVTSVWSYDGETGSWHIFTPDGDDLNDDLHTMVPGDGYWVLANGNALLLVGGSLMSPAKMIPTKKLVKGWNLIGYYGAGGQPGYYGPQENGKQAGCALDSIGDDIWSKEFSALYSYWEPYNPNMWIPFDKWKNMDPGAGYWLYAQEEADYIPTTTCPFI